MMKQIMVFVASLCLVSLAFATPKQNMKYVFPTTQEVASQVMQVSVSRIKPLVKGNNSTEVFMDLKNTGKEKHRLIAATSPIANQVQLHKTVKHSQYKENMQDIRSITITPHHQKMLKEDGVHIMLIGLKKQLKKGEMIPLTLIFADGSSIWLESQVK